MLKNCFNMLQLLFKQLLGLKSSELLYSAKPKIDVEPQNLDPKSLCGLEILRIWTKIVIEPRNPGIWGLKPKIEPS